MAEAIAGRNIADIGACCSPPTNTNTAAVVLQGVYQTQGQLWTLVVPKADVVRRSLHAQEGGSGCALYLPCC